MSREFEVVVYGATGFTGRLVAEYLAGEYPDLVWAMAGRSQDKLESVRAEMGIDPDTPLIVANSDDPDSLSAMAQRTRAVITTVGPYQLYGEPLVAACASAGTDYVDLCGEPAWMADIIRDYTDTAKASGARIVLSCGFDSVPFDMGVFFTQEAAKAKFGQPAKAVRGRVRKMQGTFSGGTAASFAETMKRAAVEPEILDTLKNPFALAGGKGPTQPTGHKPIYEEDLGSWSAPFIMASINTKNVHRSNHLMDHAYGADFTYDEMMLTGDGERGEATAKHVASANAFGDNPPKPGEGPSKAEREAGFYEVMFVGETADGDRIVTSVAGDRDPGYGSTSKMIAECALCLTRDRGETPGGIYTPAPAMGADLIDRLQAHGVMTFKVEA